jgi:phenylacetic acid degradation operon negative regulatory protein
MNCTSSRGVRQAARETGYGAKEETMATPAPLAPDPLPALSRRHAAGADSARGLLFTVLGEFVLPTGGSAWTSAFIEVFGRLGVEEKAIRQALARTATDPLVADA